MHADLMGPSGQWMHLQQSMLPESLQGSIFADCLATPINPSDRHHFPVHSVSSHRCLDPSRWGRRFAIHERLIYFYRLAQSKLVLQKAMCQVIFCQQDQTGSVFIQPVHHPRPFFASYPSISGAMSQGCMHQGAVDMPCCRVHYHSSRFVHHHKVFILEDDIQWDVFRYQLCWRRCRYMYSEITSP